jgi:hypothetical protein
MERKTAVEVDMTYSQSPPLAEDEWLAEPAAPEPALRHPDAHPERRIVTGPQATAHAPPSFGRKGLRRAVDRPSLGRRILRNSAWFLIAVSIGVGGTIAAQTDAARQVLATQAPTLAALLSVAPVKSFGVAAPTPQIGPLASPLASDLDALRRSVELLAAKQDQMVQNMAQNVAMLQAVEQDIRQKLSYTPPSQPQQVVVSPQPKPPQVRGAQPASVPRPAPGAPAPVPSR